MTNTTYAAFITPVWAATFTSTDSRQTSLCHRRRFQVMPRVPASRRCNRAPRTITSEMVRVRVPITVEAPVNHCYDLFSDLSTMSDWSSTLRSVKRDPADETISTWKFQWSGITLSWKARDLPPTSEDGDHVVRWCSISGLTHTGCVTFDPIGSEQFENTKIVMTIDYDIAALVAVVMQSGFVSSFVEGAIKADLSRFRSYALRMLRKKHIHASSA